MRLVFTALACLICVSVFGQTTIYPKNASYGSTKGVYMKVSEVKLSRSETILNLLLTNNTSYDQFVRYARPGHRKAYKLYNNNQVIATLTGINKSGTFALSPGEIFNLRLIFTPIQKNITSFDLIENTGLNTPHNIFNISLDQRRNDQETINTKNNNDENRIMINFSKADISINKIAVFGKESELCNGTKNDGSALAEVIEMGLLGIYNVVERKHLNQILDEQRLAMSGLILDDSDFASAGCLAGAQGTILASYGCIQEQTKIIVKLVDCSTSDLYWSAIGLGVSEFELINELRQRLE